MSETFGGKGIITALGNILCEIGEMPESLADLAGWIEKYTKLNYLTENKARSGREVLWYLDQDEHEAAVYIDTGEKLTEEEIEKELI